MCDLYSWKILSVMMKLTKSLCIQYTNMYYVTLFLSCMEKMQRKSSVMTKFIANFHQNLQFT